MHFSTVDYLKNMRPPLRDIKTSSGIVSASNFESQLIVHAKWDQLKLTINLVKCDFWNVY